MTIIGYRTTHWRAIIFNNSRQILIFIVPGSVMLLYKQSHPNQIRSVVERVTLLALVDMLFYTADMTYFDIDEFLAVVLLPI